MYRVISGNIVESTCTAIVNSLGAGEQINVPGRLYHCILSASSDAKALMDKVTHDGKNLPFGSVFMTDAYGLPCEKILHVITPFKKFDPDYSQIKQCYINLLEFALKEDIETICVPLIGTGANGYSTDKVADIARKVCYRFSEEHPEIGILLNILSAEEEIEVRRSSSVRLGSRLVPSNYHGHEDGEEEPSYRSSTMQTPRPSLLKAIGIDFDDSFATLVRKLVFTRNRRKSKKEQEDELEETWLGINGIIGDYKENKGELELVMEEVIKEIKTYREAKKAGLMPKKGIGSYLTKSTHAPQYEWKKVLKDGKYTWQCPTKAEILLSCVVLKVKPEDALEIYTFCGYSLSPYNLYDRAFRECTQYLGKRDAWTNIVREYHEITEESIYYYKEERRKIIAKGIADELTI